MLVKLMTGAAAAAIAMMLIPAEPADARSKKFRFYPYYGGYYLAPRYHRPRFYNYNYYDPGPFREYEFEQGYYDPYYDAPPQPRKLKKKKTAKAGIPSAVAKKKPALAAGEPSEADAGKAEVKTARSGSIDCDKAQSIIGGYGFDSVKASDCDGQLYAFTARRGGKPYTIKLSSASGELTEVKKVE